MLNAYNGESVKIIGTNFSLYLSYMRWRSEDGEDQNDTMLTSRKKCEAIKSKKINLLSRHLQFYAKMPQHIDIHSTNDSSTRISLLEISCQVIPSVLMSYIYSTWWRGKHLWIHILHMMEWQTPNSPYIAHDGVANDYVSVYSIWWPREHLSVHIAHHGVVSDFRIV